MTETTTREPRKQRPRRIAADEAHAWARNLQLHNPYAKLVLSMLTIYVNGDGAAIVGIPTLAADCELAPDTVRRRLAWLESIGAIARISTWVDENGQRNQSGRGRRTTDEIRFLTDTDPDLIEARALGQNPSVSVESDEADPSSQQGSENQPGPSPQQGSGEKNLAQDSISPPPGLDRPSESGEGLTSEPEPEPDDSPQPPEGGRSAETSDQAKGREVEGWPEFVKAFTADDVPILRMSLGETLFASLKPDERELATKAAEGLIAFRSREKRPGTKPSVQTFLREPHAWPGFAKRAPEPKQELVFLDEAAPEYQALKVAWRIADNNRIQQPRFDSSQGKSGFWAKPRGDQLDFMALEKFAVESFDQWVIVREKTPEFAAWAERLRRWIGGKIEGYVIYTGAEKPFTYNNETTMVKERVTGFRVPMQWPPRKDGTLSGEAAA